ncbi:ubiquitin-conjugating enzyme/RWD-like protein [Lophiotrema nucula]|uniref:Ubiquitin-conjugating enzyme E2 2 n=1 Tax=Lophiotrema nucula TaxID=690887 RepID=A0A6A5ZM29_9PLEO|nr:ubiquitin-conjugating enzyme/RWD-like protein [Lophiotrema nucula]
MNSKSMRRLAKDHSELHRDGLPPNYLFPSSHDGSDLTSLDVLLAGPPGTPYAKGVWRLHLDIPQTYPTAPPTATFRTRMWHPNVDEASGAVCVETLKRDWVNTLKLRDVLVTVSCLLIQPNPASALNEAAGVLASEDWEGYCRRAALMTNIHAVVPIELVKEVREAQSRGEDQDAIMEEAKVVEGEVNGKGKERLAVGGTPMKSRGHSRLVSEDEENRRRRGDTVEPESDPESDWIPGPLKSPKALPVGRDNIFGIKGLADTMQLDTPPTKVSASGSKVSITDEVSATQVISKVDPSFNPFIAVPSKPLSKADFKFDPNPNPFITIPSKPLPKAALLTREIAIQTPKTSPFISTLNPFAAIAPITDEHPLMKEFSWSWAESEVLHDTSTNIEDGETKPDVRKRMATEEFEKKRKWELKRFKKAGFDINRYNRGDFGPRTGIARL